MNSLEVDPHVESLLRSAATRAAAPLPRRHLRVELVSALALIAACAAMALWLPVERERSWQIAALLLAALTAASGVRFTIGAHTGSPTQPFMVAAFLLLPPVDAVAVALLADVLVRLPDYVRRRTHPDHLLLHFGDAWPAVGGAFAYALLASGAPDLAQWWVLIVALAAQFTVETVTFEGRSWLADRVPPSLSLRIAGISFLVDAALAPLGLLLAYAAVDEPLALLFVLPLVGLLAVFARERDRRIEQALALSDAYRGTALLMGEMLEAGDPYTGGEHSWGVVALVLQVGDRLGVTGKERRDLEFAALLHDVGKLRTPQAILNKPGALTDEESEIVRRHPIDGQRMLERVGGVLGGIGPIVRAHHERLDGCGYPDGLRGDEIPLAARIICACDAFNAMTTNRPYRLALPAEHALAELTACAGSQFDPDVVAALIAIDPGDRAAAAPAPGVLTRS